jgi:hypothetical protein
LPIAIDERSPPFRSEYFQKPLSEFVRPFHAFCDHRSLNCDVPHIERTADVERSVLFGGLESVDCLPNPPHPVKAGKEERFLLTERDLFAC